MARKDNDPVRVQSQTLNQSSQKRRGRKVRTTDTFVDDATNTNQRTGEVTTNKVTQTTKTKTNRRGKTKTKTKFKSDFQVRDAEGNLLMKDKKRITSRNGKTRINRNRAKVTRNYRKSN